tara:strand:+ start:1025 stop:1441 length:417 start_codon:yes stop_codon:yes gene_type:complete
LENKIRTMELKSIVSISKLSAKDLFRKLSVVKNFEKIMPNNISKFDVLNSDSFIFGIKGMPTFQLKIIEKIESEKIILKSLESKIDFYLEGNIKELNDKNTQFYIEFKGQLNPMMEIMVKTPLQTFINDLSKNIVNLK